jgi:hypothetical protein
LLYQFLAAAMGTFSLAFIAATFKQLGYLAAVIAFIFVNRHSLSLPNKTLMQNPKRFMLRHSPRIININPH